MGLMKSKQNKRSNSITNTADTINAENLEVRPGGMLVQRRDSNSNIHNSFPIPTIKLKVKYGHLTHQIFISSQASFGELKKMLVEVTGVHHWDQKLIYKKKERDSREFLDVSGVKDGSKIKLIEDVTNRERRLLELRKTDKITKATNSLQKITSEVDSLGAKVVALEATNCRDGKAIDSLIEMLMGQLNELDGIVADGDLKLQTTLQIRRVQKYIESLDKLKLQNLMDYDSPEKMATSSEQKQMPVQQQVLKHSDSTVITTDWETFD
ncbi:BAG family molecular chaperone regulator 1-like [Mercurialis annua]|uniref:BAG family molecular chaperone regulator 1-like n=1 Tax=Mercurialis annua TaxID=3986 RepID=UPI00215ED910|nr:BAG family molecular chaperone regulator 1-like [Mercurialis annua]